LSAVGVVVDGDVLDVGEVFEEERELLFAEGGLLRAQVLVREVAEGFCVGGRVPCWSLRF
jgi:hypothetical protein